MTDADDLLASPAEGGEIRRLTILYADLVDSTVLSTRVGPETYHLLVGRYRQQVLAIVNQYEGHIGSTKGDGLLAVFGHPIAHEDDVQRAVLAGLAISRDVSRLSAMSKRQFGIELSVRVGVHRGPVYLDIVQDDVYGFGANLAARVSGLAPPGTVVVSDAVEPLVRDAFELEAQPPAPVKGVDDLIVYHRVIGERLVPAKAGKRPLVGRDRETRRLHRSWARAQAGTLNTPGVVLRGEAGIGKSRLAAVADEIVERSGGVVLELAGSAIRTGTGLHPVRTLLERRCGIGRLTTPQERLRLLEADVAALDLAPDIAALLAPVVGIAPEAGYLPVAAEGAKLYELIGAAVQDYLLACFDDRPGLLVAEDLHWFDPSTMDLLGSLLHAADGRLMVVMTARPGVWLPDEWPVKEVELSALTNDQTDTLITALNPGLTAAERTTVQRRCDGVPFYIEQVVAGLGGAGVPDALYEPLFARLRASANAVPVVQAAGIIGRNVDRGLLGTVCTLSETDIDDVIDELEDALVLEQWGIDGWRFRHELLREVAVELAPPSVRRRLHAKVADALVGVGGDPDWGVVAGHYQRAERFADAAKVYQQASTAARRRGALAEARGYLTRGLAQLDRTAPGPERERNEMSVRMERGWLVAAADGLLSTAAAADFKRCLELTATDPLDDEMIETRLDLVESYVMRSELREADELLGSLRRDVGPDQPWSELIVDIWFGIVAWLRGEFDSARSQLGQATATFAETAAPEEEVYNLVSMIVTAYTDLASTHVVHGELAAAEVAIAHAERLAGDLGFPEGQFSLAYARFVEIWLRVETGELERASALAAELATTAERHGLEILRLFGTTWQASIDALAVLSTATVDPSALSAHIIILTDLVDRLRKVELNEFVTYFGGVIARTLIAANQRELARTGLDSLLQQGGDTGMRLYDAELLRLRARTHTDEAARGADIAAALELARSQGATLFELRAAIDDVEFRGQPARGALIDALSRFPAESGWPDLVRARDVIQ